MICDVLNGHLKYDADGIWKPECQAAMDEWKRHIAHSKVVSHIDYYHQIDLLSDSLKRGVGGYVF